jgi:hypothetical protein
LGDSPNDALKQKILSDAEINKNKVIVVYDAATGEKNVIRQPSHTQRLEFFENIFCKRLRSSKVWLLLLSSTPTRGTIPFCLNFISHAPLIFCVDLSDAVGSGAFKTAYNA